MASDTIALVNIDKRFPSTIAGDGGKVVQVKEDEEGYEHVPAAGRLVGEIILWPLDTAPTGYLSCRSSADDTTEYATEDYPALGELLESVLPGSSGEGYFQTPVIVFAKNSGGSDTLTVEAASVGTHGHTAAAAGTHGHTVSVSSSGNHQHNVYRRYQAGVGNTNWCFDNVNKESVTQTTDSAGAHGHSASVDSQGSHSHTINNHTGVNQPACTKIHYCIKH